MASEPQSFVWFDFPDVYQEVNEPVNSFYIYCLDQTGNYYTSSVLTFTIFIVDNTQFNGNTGSGQLTSGSTLTAQSVPKNDGMALFNNLVIDHVGVYTFGCYVTDLGTGLLWPAQNFLESPPVVVLSGAGASPQYSLVSDAQHSLLEAQKALTTAQKALAEIRLNPPFPAASSSRSGNRSEPNGRSLNGRAQHSSVSESE